MVSVALPLLLVPRLTPVGGVSVSVIVAVGEPGAVTVKVPPVPATKLALSALVKAGADCAALTVSVKDCVAAVPTPLSALKCNVYVPAAADEPTVSVALPLLLVPRLTPVGGVSVSVIVAVGEPDAVTVKVPPVPAAKLALSALVNAGAVCAALTVSVKDCVA